MINMIINFDRKLLMWFYSMGQNLPSFILKLSAEYLVYLLPITLLVLWFWQKTHKKVLRAFLAVMLSWPVIATIIGKVVNRPRPFESGGVQELLFHRPTYSFPSDHAAAFFALAFSLLFSGDKKLGMIFLVLSLINSLARIASGIHWPLDILGGMVVGFAGALIVKLLDKYLDKIYKFIISIAQKMRLA